jgi:hypothetical protein
VLLNDMLPEAWPLLVCEASYDSANHCSHGTPNDSTAARSGRRARSSPTGLRLHGKGEGAAPPDCACTAKGKASRERAATAAVE